MEVASPLTFNQGKTGTKRAFGCSPLLDTSNTAVVGMEVTDDRIEPTLKRRRFNDHMDATRSTGASSHSPSPFASMGWPMRTSPQSHGPANGSSLKRGRLDSDQHQEYGRDLRIVVQEQAAEIDSLKQDKASLESSANELRAENEKVVNENRILKRAVTIQQERQNDATSEIEAAQRYKAEAEDRMRKLEQMILTLRYHLQTQSSGPGNDFMSFTPQNPDVF